VVRAHKLAVLLKDNAQLLLHGHVCKESIEGLAASNEVVWIVRSTVGYGNKVFNASLGLRDGAIAEEAQPTLDKEHALQGSGWHVYVRYLRCLT
jgi:hypothetical protein